MPPSPEVEIHPGPEAAARACARRIVAAAARAIAERGRFTLALTGGRTPLATYVALATEHARDVDWRRVDFCVGDERMVPYDDPRSNFGAARAAWLGRLGLPAEALHPMPVGRDDAEGAERYERTLRALAPGGLDLVMLGLGDDGHVASLFPGKTAALPRGRWVVAAEAPPTSPVRRRMTLTFEAFAAAGTVVFQVCGASKSAKVADVLAGRGDHPAGAVRAREHVVWILDEDAARGWRAEQLSRPPAS